jgi:hypothetical protein
MNKDDEGIYSMEFVLNFKVRQQLHRHKKRSCKESTLDFIFVNFMYSALLTGAIETCMEIMFGSFIELKYMKVSIFDFFFEMPVLNCFSMLLVFIFLAQFVGVCYLIYSNVVCKLDPVRVGKNMQDQRIILYDYVFVRKYGSLYEGVYTQKKWALAIQIIFIVRRLFMVLTIVFLDFNEVWQIQVF